MSTMRQILPFDIVGVELKMCQFVRQRESLPFFHCGVVHMDDRECVIAFLSSAFLS